MTKRSPTARPHADRIPRVPVGPLALTVLGECTGWLAAQQYSPRSAAGIVNLLGRLSLWMQEVGAGVDDISGELLERFVVTEAFTRLRVRHGEELGKKDLKACVRTPSPTRRNSRRQEIRTFATTTNALLQLRDWLVEQQVTLVVLEATGDYWRGVYYLLEDTLNVMLVNAAHARGLPGRKTDVSDSAWLAQLGECGLLKPSFVPPEPVRHLRDLTRYRATLAVERTREAQRLEEDLEDAGIKISSVATDILGASGRAMLAALIAGQDDAQVMADMARGRLRTKIPALAQALTGNLGRRCGPG